MSLINEALKRAKQAQQEAAPPPAPNLQLRPIEPTQYPRHSFGLVMPASIAVVALLLLFFVWQRAQPKGLTAPMEIQARAAMPAPPVAAPEPAPAAVAPIPTAEAVPDAQPAPSAAPEASPAVTPPADPPSAVPQDTVVANPAAVTEAPPPKPALPKLQGIVFSPTRPSVMIGGKTLFIGDKLNGLRVTAVSQESVTLVGAGQTNVLTLAE